VREWQAIAAGIKARTRRSRRRAHFSKFQAVSAPWTPPDAAGARARSQRKSCAAGAADAASFRPATFAISWKSTPKEPLTNESISGSVKGSWPPKSGQGKLRGVVGGRRRVEGERQGEAGGKIHGCMNERTNNINQYNK
jgi:hypothetical protein